MTPTKPNGILFRDESGQIHKWSRIPNFQQEVDLHTIALYGDSWNVKWHDIELLSTGETWGNERNTRLTHISEIRIRNCIFIPLEMVYI